MPAMLLESLHEHVQCISQLQADIGAIERRLAQQLRESTACKALAEIPGVGDHAGVQQLAGGYWRAKDLLLAQVVHARPGSRLATAAEATLDFRKPVRDAATEARHLGERLVHMDRVVVARKAGDCEMSASVIVLENGAHCPRVRSSKS
jgi:hypothetical protein